VSHEQVDQQAACDADRKAEDIDERISPISRQVADGDFEVVGKHTTLVGGDVNGIQFP